MYSRKQLCSSFFDFLQYTPVAEHTIKEDSTAIENEYKCMTTLKKEKTKTTDRVNRQTNTYRKILIMSLKLSINASEEILLY